MKRENHKKHLLLIGRGSIAVNCLNILYKHQALPQVIICDKKDDGVDTWTYSLYKRALELGYKENDNLYRESRVNKDEFIDLIKKKHPPIDIIFSVQPKSIFRKPFINLARDYVVNLHFAPLPKLRGVAPCAWAILDGLTKMGVTLHLIQDEGIDNGPIIDQALFPIKKKDTTWSLYQGCIKAGTKLFEKSLPSILQKRIRLVGQNLDAMTYHPMGELDYSQCEIDLTQDPVWLYKFIKSRIFPPLQLPYFVYNGNKIGILDMRLVKNSTKISKPTISVKNQKYTISFPRVKFEIDKVKVHNS